MPLDKQRLEKLKELLKITNEGLSRKEFLEAFKKVINQVLKIEARIIKRSDEAINEMNSKHDTLLKATRDDLSDLFDKLKGLVDVALKEQENGLNFIRDKVRKIKVSVDGTTPVKGIDYFDGDPGEPGKDADEEKIVEKVLGKIDIPDSTEEIEKLREELKENKRLKGGGTSAIGVKYALQRLLKTEEPVGLINGTNKEYTVTGTIFAIFAFSLNGEVVTQLPNYTISKNKITFSTALPAAYSGKDFEVKYV